MDGGDSQGESEGCQQCDQISATLGNFSKSLATSYLHNSPTFLGIFCKGVKIFKFSSEIIWGNFYRHLVIFSGHTGCQIEREIVSVTSM